MADLEPVISPERWDQVQLALAMRKGAPKSPQRCYPLSDGPLIAPCGDHYHGFFRNDTGTPKVPVPGLQVEAVAGLAALRRHPPERLGD